MSVIWLPKISNLFIDKLSMTLDIHDKHKMTLIEDFKTYVDTYEGSKLGGCGKYLFSKKVYIEGSSVLFQCAPLLKNMNFFRIEFNPAKVPPAEIVKMIDPIIPGGYTGLIDKGRITRIDLAFDCKFLPVSNLFFHCQGMSVSKTHMKSGKIQSAYLGPDGSTQMVFYDKMAESKKKNNKQGTLYKTIVPSVSTTRIECRLHPEGHFTFNKLLSSNDNPFKKLSLGVLTGQPKMPTNDFEGFVRLVFELSLNVGLQQALLAAPAYRRGAIKNAILKSCKTKWWKPDELWKTFPAALEPIINPVMPDWYPKKAKNPNAT